MTSILLIEDNADLAFGLKNNLEIEGYDVTLATDGQAALSAVETQRPDLVVLDLMLPGADGYRVLRQMREDGVAAPVLILTAKTEEADKVRGFRCGADDYVTKPFGVLELLARIEALLRRSQPKSAAKMVRIGDIEMHLDRRVVIKHGREITLTPLEFDLLKALSDRDGALASRVALLTEVWGHAATVLTRTVDTHIAELRRKLEDDPAKPRHILTVRKAGYRLQR